MGALIAYLRTIKPTGEPTPVSPPDFEASVTGPWQGTARERLEEPNF